MTCHLLVDGDSDKDAGAGVPLAQPGVPRQPPAIAPTVSHQQQLLLAIFDKVVSKDSLSVGRLTDLQKVAGGLFTLDLGTSSIGDWLFTLKDLRSRLEVTTILVTHDQDEALELSQHIVLLEEGRVAQAGRQRERERG